MIDFQTFICASISVDYKMPSKQPLDITTEVLNEESCSTRQPVDIEGAWRVLPPPSNSPRLYIEYNFYQLRVSPPQHEDW